LVKDMLTIVQEKMTPNHIAKLTERFEKALVYATQLHSLQVRKQTGVPYISHLLSVTALVLEDGGNEDEAIAALLHDAVEDQGGMKTREVILQHFGETVTAIVDGCTESSVTPKPPWRDRKLRYLQQISQGSVSVRRVALADKLHNARSILSERRQQGEIIWEKFSGGKEGTLWFYRAFVEIYEADNFQSILLPELKQVLHQLESDIV
jgi:(p)ppGpp synthase/HD superfamily hydrolase